MMDFLSMLGTYEERKVSHYEDVKSKTVVDTCRVTDSEKDFETGICHPAYNKGTWVIVELYDTEEQAKKGHNKWVKKMTAKALPRQLKDVSSSETAKLCDMVSSKWRGNKKGVI